MTERAVDQILVFRRDFDWLWVIWSVITLWPGVTIGIAEREGVGEVKGNLEVEAIGSMR